MVSADVTTSAQRIQDVLESRDVQGVALVGASVASGVILAQELSDRLLPAVGMPRDPTNAKQFAGSAASKALVGLGVGYAAAQFQGIPLIVMAFAGAGAVGSAAADLINAVQRTGLAAENPRGKTYYQSGSGTQTSRSTNRGSSSNGQTASVTV